VDTQSFLFMAHFLLPQQPQIFPYKKHKSFIRRNSQKYLTRTAGEIKGISNILHPVSAGNVQNNRIIESFGLEGTPRGHLVQPPHSEQGHR